MNTVTAIYGNGIFRPLDFFKFTAGQWDGLNRSQFATSSQRHRHSIFLSCAFAE